jgi:hypothetical protein
MLDFSRVITTAIIWTGAIIALYITGESSPENMLWVALIFGAAAGLATIALWMTKMVEKSWEVRGQREKSKGAGRDRIIRLIETLSDDDLRDLGTALEDLDSTRLRR